MNIGLKMCPFCGSLYPPEDVLKHLSHGNKDGQALYQCLACGDLLTTSEFDYHQETEERQHIDRAAGYCRGIIIETE